MLDSKPKKILEENTGNKVSDIAHRNFFIGYIFQGKGNKGNNKQMGLHQRILPSKGKHNKIKIQPTEWENIH